jgi:hypothetical protein
VEILGIVTGFCHAAGQALAEWLSARRIALAVALAAALTWVGVPAIMSLLHLGGAW